MGESTINNDRVKDGTANIDKTRDTRDRKKQKQHTQNQQKGGGENAVRGTRGANTKKKQPKLAAADRDSGATLHGTNLAERLSEDINRQPLPENDSDDIRNCLDPNGPQPVILMSLGRSGSSSTWQVIGNLTGQETKSVEYTGSTRKESIEFFNKIGPNDGGRWIMKYMCFMQRLFPTAGVVGFKWKPNRSILTMDASVNGLRALGKLKEPYVIKVVRSRRNLLDVLISRYKHKRSTENVPAHCTVGDKECLNRQLKAGIGVELPGHKIVRLLNTLTAEENEVDKQLKTLGVPRIHASFEKLYYGDDANEWKKIVRFLIGANGQELTMDKVRSAMKHASTSHPSHRITIQNFEEIRSLLNGTKYEKLLHP